MADMRQAAAIVMRRCCYLVILMVLAATPARGLQTVVQVSPVDCMRYAKDLNYLLVGSKSLVIILNATSLAEVARFDIVGAVPLVGDGISSRISPLSALLDNSSADLPCALYDLGSLALLQRDEQPGGSAGERSNVVALSNNRLLGVRPAEGGGLSLLTFAAEHTAAFMDNIALANVSDWHSEYVYFSDVTSDGFWRIFSTRSDISGGTSNHTARWFDISLVENGGNAVVNKSDVIAQATADYVLLGVVPGTGSEVIHVIKSGSSLRIFRYSETPTPAVFDLSIAGSAPTATAYDAAKNALFMAGPTSLERVALAADLASSRRLTPLTVAGQTSAAQALEVGDGRLYLARLAPGMPHASHIVILSPANCSRFDTCQACLAEADPYCGWCGESDATCPTVSGQSPQEVFADHGGNITIFGAAFAAAGSYECAFHFSQSEKRTPAWYINSTAVACKAPDVDVPSQVGYIDTTDVSLHYYFNANSTSLQHVIQRQGATAVVRFYSCDKLSDCTSCLGLNSRLSVTTCGWCSGACTSVSTCTSGVISDPSGCPAPAVSSASPLQGVASGGAVVVIQGSNLGSSTDDVRSVLVAGVPCAVFVLMNSQTLRCVLGATGTALTDPQVGPISVMLWAHGPSLTVSQQFSYYPDPVITSFSPLRLPRAGGADILVSGRHFSRAQQSTATLGGIQMTLQVKNDTFAVVKVPVYASAGDNPIQPSTGVSIEFQMDEAVAASLPTFSFAENPELLGCLVPAMGVSSFLPIILAGTNLSVRPIRVLFGDVFCSLISVNDTSVSCRLESIPSSLNAAPISIYPTLEMDGFSADFPVAELLLYPDPVVLAFEPRNASVVGGANITLVGTDLFHGQAPSISVAGVPCAVAFANISFIICTLASAPDARSGPVVLTIGSFTSAPSVDDFTFWSPASPTSTSSVAPSSTASPPPADLGAAGLPPFAVPVIAAVAGVLGLLLIIVAAWTCSRRAKSRRRTKGHHMELLQERSRASTVYKDAMQMYSDQSRLTSAAQQRGPTPLIVMDAFISKWMSTSASSPLPRRGSIVVTDKAIALRLLLRSNVPMTVTVLQTISDACRVPERRYLASSFIVAFRDDFEFATDVVFALLAHYMEVQVRIGNGKQLFADNTAIAMILFSYWLAFTLPAQKYTEALGALMDSVEEQVNRGPVDMLTGASYYSINRHTVLREPLSYERVSIVVTLAGKPAATVEACSCDSPAQLKRRALKAHHVPPAAHADYEIFSTTTGEPLVDWREGERKVATLRDYGLSNRSEVALMIQRGGSSSPPLTDEVVYHLAEPSESPDDSMPSDLCYARMLTVKENVYVCYERFTGQLLSVRDAPPSAVKRLFDFLDVQCRNLRVGDPLVKETWKNNAYILQLWASCIRQPELLFEVQAAPAVAACMQTISDVFVDACSPKGSAVGLTSRPLFESEVGHVRDSLRRFQAHVQNAPSVSAAIVPLPTSGEQFDIDTAAQQLALLMRSHGESVREATKNSALAAELHALL